MAESNRLTDREFWVNYWESKQNLIFKVADNYPFLSRIKEIIKEGNYKSLLEIGGFPGYYSVALGKEGVATTLLDFVVHRTLLHELERFNGLKEGSVGVIEGDVFKIDHSEKFDLVMSNGLIEHFTNTEEILERHVAFLADKGTLFVSLPNFRGLNGWFQRVFDRENYDKHNIQSMDLELLRKACQNLGLKNIEVAYNGGFMLWLEDPQKHSTAVKIFQKMVWLPLKVFFKLVPIETKWFSPYIVVKAQK